MEEKEIELRSEEVQEVLGAVPHWILRRGIVIVAIVVTALLTGSWFFKYPNIIVATMTLTSDMPPASLIAKTNGALKELYVGDRQPVKEKEYLAVIENPASTKEMLMLKNNLRMLLQHPDSLAFFPAGKELQLGNVQELYAAFTRSLHNYRQFTELDYYPQKIAAIQERLCRYQQYLQGLKRQQQIVEEQYQLAGVKYYRDSLLQQKDFLSRQELENTQTQYLQSRLSLENSYVTTNNLRIVISELQETLLDTEQQYSDKKSSLESELSTAITQLMNEINTWEMNYVLIAPFDGQITFTKYWNENQNITAGEIVFSVIPDKETGLVGKALLPIARSGKVTAGQTVNIYFVNFPDEEFGFVKGVVKNISLVPVNEHYTVEVILPYGLNTTYKKELPFSQEMAANVEIVTEDLRLLERIFFPIKKLLDSNLY